MAEAGTAITLKVPHRVVSLHHTHKVEVAVELTGNIEMTILTLA